MLSGKFISDGWHLRYNEFAKYVHRNNEFSKSLVLLFLFVIQIMVFYSNLHVSSSLCFSFTVLAVTVRDKEIELFNVENQFLGKIECLI